MARIKIKNKRVQFLVTLFFLVLLSSTLLNQVKEACLAFLLTSGGQTTEGRVSRTWSSYGRRGYETHYVAYEFDVDGQIYHAEHVATKSVMLQARETRVVEVYYLPGTPRANAPLFWGESVPGYVLRVGLGVLLLGGLCVVLVWQAWVRVQRDEKVLQVWRYTLPEALLGLVILVSAGLGMRQVLTWSNRPILDWGFSDSLIGQLLIPILVLVFLVAIFGMLLMQEKD